jgi:hypothetical protein
MPQLENQSRDLEEGDVEGMSSTYTLYPHSNVLSSYRK